MLRVNADGHEPTWSLGRIDVPRASDLLAGQLRQRILAGDLAEGELLPPERTLVQHTGLARASVREALRTLEAEHLIAPRLGRYGGWAVRKPGRESVERSIDVFIQGHQIRVGSLLDVREVLEPAGAALAARHRTDEDLDEMESCQAAMVTAWPDMAAYVVESSRWHYAVAAATHNELLIAFSTALFDALKENIRPENVSGPATQAHDEVTTAIRQHDEQAAYHHMQRHVRVRPAQLQSIGGGEPTN
jgi:DNA-binding FadR family transcriptional regulator